MNFPGFEAEDFDLFSIPDFAGRMGAIRSRIKPKLIALADDLTSAIEARVESPTFPHVAQHMRRRVNPPAETWVAFGRDKKGYKRWTHYRIAISEGGVRVTVFVEDDADDKAAFGANLAADPKRMIRALGADAGLCWYTIGQEGTSQAALTPEILRRTGESLQRLKTLKFQAGVPLPREKALALTPEAFEDWALQQVARLRPLYAAGVTSAP